MFSEIHRRAEQEHFSGHLVSCLGSKVAEAIIEEFSNRTGVDPSSMEFTDTAAVSWGLDSLDFVMLIEMVDQRFARKTSFPEVDLHEASLLTLALKMSAEAADCDCPLQETP